MPGCRQALVLAVSLGLPIAAGACSLVPTPGQANLAATLALRDEAGGVVAFESGQPVPTFDRQPRLTTDLDGTWRFDPQKLDTAASLTDRQISLGDIAAQVGARAGVIYDDSTWSAIRVPGTFNPPPDSSITGGYYRHDFFVPTEFTGQYALLKFGAVRYVADVWLNGKYLGYHEGGDTPFALDASAAVVPGAYNSIVVRVDNPEWGTRDDIVPWGLADWWNYGGIVGDVWLEAVPGAERGARGRDTASRWRRRVDRHAAPWLRTGSMPRWTSVCGPPRSTRPTYSTPTHGASSRRTRCRCSTIGSISAP